MNTKNEVTIFNNEEFGQVRTMLVNDKSYFLANDVARALGYKRPADAISAHCKGSVKHRYLTNGGEQEAKFIPEGDIYRLIMKSKLPSAEKFESWVMDEILPSIRKHGAYMTNEVIERTLTDPDYLIQLATALKEERQARLLAEQQVKEQEKVITYKQTLINGFVDDIPIYKKVDIINRICKKSCGGYASRYKELYKCFRENFHVDLIKKCENYNEKQEKRKDELTIIRYAEKFGYIDDLYSCCVKLYETEVKKVIEELRNVQE